MTAFDTSGVAARQAATAQQVLDLYDALLGLLTGEHIRLGPNSGTLAPRLRVQGTGYSYDDGAGTVEDPAPVCLLVVGDTPTGAAAKPLLTFRTTAPSGSQEGQVTFGRGADGGRLRLRGADGAAAVLDLDWRSVTGLTNGALRSSGLLAARRLVSNVNNEPSWTIGAGFGASATRTTLATVADDLHGLIRITANGAGLAANPTLTITGSSLLATAQGPLYLVAWAGGTGAVPTAITRSTPVAGSAVSTWTLAGITPNAGETFTLAYLSLT